VSGITAISTPGHTPGHTSFHVESAGQQLLVSGDTCNHATLSMEKPTWHVLFDMDKDEAVKTRMRILDMLATDRIPLAGYHMPFPAIGFVEKYTKPELHYHWEPASYEFTA
jgi:glyoxylase-like metal-dependent hydrolase (beta-lactamase superfamily II)